MRTVHLRRARANFRRVLRPEDLERVGIEDKVHKGRVLVWDKDNKFSVEMTNQLSDSLVAAFPNEFKAIGDGDDDDVPEVKEPMTATTRSSAGASPS